MYCLLFMKKAQKTLIVILIPPDLWFIEMDIFVAANLFYDVIEVYNCRTV